MRIAVVADIHGNHGALEAVVADLREVSPDLVLNLGDCLSGPLEPAKTADLLIDLGWTTIRGNHDRELTQTPPDRMGASDRGTVGRIGERHRAWLASLPPTLTVAPDLFLCHGTPANDMDYLTEQVAPDGAVLPARESDLFEAVAAAPGRVVLCGHTHIARLYRLRDGRIVANPGSVGLPGYDWDVPRPHVVEAGTPHARYLVMDRKGDQWHFEFRALVYDWEKAAAVAIANGRADWADVLATGRVG
ncbi:MAG: metallophosphoesterase family protein [Hyphomicrobiaceae bacterium]|jgi:predicted phosphodiesterase